MSTYGVTQQPASLPQPVRPVTPPRAKAKQKERGPLEDPMKMLGASLAQSTIVSAEGESFDNPFREDSKIKTPPKPPPEVGAAMIRGTITHVSRDKNGLPRKTGPVFNIEWDDGLKEYELSLQEMQNIVKSDEKILGGCTSLTEDVPEFIRKAGEMIGESIDFIRKSKAIEEIKAFTVNVEATVEGLFELAMNLVVKNVLRTEKVEVRTISTSNMLRTLCSLCSLCFQ